MDLGNAGFDDSPIIRATRAVLEQRDFETTARIIFDQAREVTGANQGSHEPPFAGSWRWTRPVGHEVLAFRGDD